MKNSEFLQQLVNQMYAVDDCPSLDEYGTKIFGRPINGSWKLFRYLARMAVPERWMWFPNEEYASYPPDDVPVPSFGTFATFMLHEVTHGWCYFHKKPGQWNYPTGVDEEQVCWDVSKLVCQELGITYDEAEANQSHEFHKLMGAGDMDGLEKLIEAMPAHHQIS